MLPVQMYNNLRGELILFSIPVHSVFIFSINWVEQLYLHNGTYAKVQLRQDLWQITSANVTLTETDLKIAEYARRLDSGEYAHRAQ